MQEIPKHRSNSKQNYPYTLVCFYDRGTFFRKIYLPPFQEKVHTIGISFCQNDPIWEGFWGSSSTPLSIQNLSTPLIKIEADIQLLQQVGEERQKYKEKLLNKSIKFICSYLYYIYSSVNILFYKNCKITISFMT